MALGFGRYRQRKQEKSEENKLRQLQEYASQLGKKPEKPKAGLLGRLGSFLGSLDTGNAVYDEMKESRDTGKSFNPLKAVGRYGGDVVRGVVGAFSGNIDNDKQGYGDIVEDFTDIEGKWTKRALGGAGDILLAPSTYLTGGASKLAQGGAKTLSKGSIKEINKLVRKEIGTKEARNSSKYVNESLAQFGKTSIDSSEVLEDIRKRITDDFVKNNKVKYREDSLGYKVRNAPVIKQAGDFMADPISTPYRGAKAIGKATGSKSVNDFFTATDKAVDAVKDSGRGLFRSDAKRIALIAQDLKRKGDPRANMVEQAAQEVYRTKGAINEAGLEGIKEGKIAQELKTSLEKDGYNFNELVDTVEQSAVKNRDTKVWQNTTKDVNDFVTTDKGVKFSGEREAKIAKQILDDTGIDSVIKGNKVQLRDPSELKSVQEVLSYEVPKRANDFIQSSSNVNNANNAKYELKFDLGEIGQKPAYTPLQSLHDDYDKLLQTKSVYKDNVASTQSIDRQLKDLEIKITQAQTKAISDLTKRIFGNLDKANIQVVEKILTDEGQSAWGQYVDRWISLVDGNRQIEDTFLHESVHKATDLFMTVSEKAKILDYVLKNKSGSKVINGTVKDFKSAEEWLAENFVNYIRTGKGVKDGTLIRFFEDLLNRLKSVIGNKDQIDAFYRDLNTGRFADKAPVKQSTSLDPMFEAVEKGGNNIPKQFTEFLTKNKVKGDELKSRGLIGDTVENYVQRLYKGKIDLDKINSYEGQNKNLVEKYKSGQELSDKELSELKDEGLFEDFNASTQTFATSGFMDGKKALRGSDKQRVFDSVKQARAEGYILDSNFAKTVGISERNFREAIAFDNLSKNLSAIKDPVSGDSLVKTIKQGEEIPKGYKEIEVPMGIVNPFKGMALPEDVAPLIENFYKRYSQPEEINKVLKLVDKFNGIWKTTVTKYFPGFHTRNKIGGISNNLVAGVNPLEYPQLEIQSLKLSKLNEAVQNNKITPKIQKQLDEQVKGLGLTYSELLKVAREQRIFNAGQLSELKEFDFDAKKWGINKPLGGKVGKTFDRLGSLVEDTNRLTLFIDRLKKGDDALKAGMDVAKWHFDYSDMSKFEKDVLRRIIPFYTFMKNNLELHLTEALKQPVKYKLIIKGIQSGQNTDMFTDEDGESFLPEWMQDKLNIPMGGADGDMIRMITGFGLPIEALQDVVGNDTGDTLRQVAASTNPLLKTFIEQATGNNLFKDKKIKEDNSGYSYRNMPEKIQNLLEYKEVDVPDGKGGVKYTKYTVNPEKKYWYELLTSRAGTTGKNLATAFAGDADDMGQMGLNLLTGVRAYDIDPKQEKDKKTKKDLRELQDFFEDQGLGGTADNFYLYKDTKEKLGIKDKKKKVKSKTASRD